MRERLKRFVFGLIGKEADAVVVSFASGDPQLVKRMTAEIQQLVPDRRHFVVSDENGSAWAIYWRLRRRFRKFRIGLAPVLFTSDREYAPLRRTAFLLAPLKILAYNGRLERHHLQLGSWVASLLFLRGVPLDRIWLRPKWLVPWTRDRSVYPKRVREFEGRPFVEGRKRVAIVTPYFPWPLSHGGAVRIYYLLREIASEFDVVLVSFSEDTAQAEACATSEFCSRIVLVDKPRYREPRWSTLAPPEVAEYRSRAMREALARIRRDYRIDAVQVEYTSLAPYRGDILVEHDVTFNLYEQVWRRERSLSAWWDYWRWRRFERKWVWRYGRVVVMSEEDRALLGTGTVVPNGVDLARFRPEIERPGQRLLFIGSFRHFPNIVAFRFFMEDVWPRLHERMPEVRVTVVAGPDPLLYWREHTGLAELPQDDRVHVIGFVSDVRPLYVESNLVLVPTLVSAGTNLKVLEALAMDRAVVSTSSGCAGFGLQPSVNVWIADSAEAFADGVRTLLEDRDLRQRIAGAGRRHAEEHFDWDQIGAKQRGLLREVGEKGVGESGSQEAPKQRGLPRAAASSAVKVRRVLPEDIERIIVIQATAPEASQWTREDYLNYDCHVALVNGAVAGFLVSRRIHEAEREILNVAVHPEMRRAGIASELIRAETRRWPGTHFLEVRESNTPARQLYRRLGFEEAGSRPDYYDTPPESAIVMRIHS
jgi:ribosomal protein S18 acetylase RimI-like enzyme/glycosyltransferase involved in cell wall biosynthesis